MGYYIRCQARSEGPDIKPSLAYHFVYSGLKISASPENPVDIKGATIAARDRYRRLPLVDEAGSHCPLLGIKRPELERRGRFRGRKRLSGCNTEPHADGKKWGRVVDGKRGVGVIRLMLSRGKWSYGQVGRRVCKLTFLSSKPVK